MTSIIRRGAMLPTVFAAALTMSACDSIFGPRESPLLRDQLTRGEAMWQEQGVTHYSMVVTRGPLYAEGHRAVRLEIANGQIVAAAYFDDETAVEADVLAEHETVEQLFDRVREALDLRVPGIFVRYDEDYGFPDTIQIDYDPARLDDDLIIQVSDFTPLTN